MTGFDKLAALLDPAAKVGNDAFAEESEGVEDLAPGAAIVALVVAWFAEHWPALAIGGAAGLLAIAIPALIIAPALAQ